MKNLLLVGIIALFTLAGSSVLAEDRFENGVTEYRMDKENVHGEVVGPNGDIVTGRQQAKQHSLIKVRGNFIPQMLKSVEDI